MFQVVFKDESRDNERKELLKISFSQTSTFDMETVERGVDYMLKDPEMAVEVLRQMLIFNFSELKEKYRPKQNETD